jgi:two-component system, NtrC family, nitrogen regulation sensor histidine kinase NtrY
MPRPLVHLLLSALFGALALVIHEPDGRWGLEQQAERLQHELHRQAQELEHLDELWLERLLQLGPERWMRDHALELERENARTGLVLLGFSGDSLVVWSGQAPLPLASFRELPRATVHHGGNIVQHAVATAEGSRMHALRPVWTSPPLENRYLQDGFHPSLGVVKGAAVAEGGEHGPEVIDRTGTRMFRLAWRDGTLETGTWIWLRLFLFLLTAIFFIAGLWAVAERLLRAGKAWAGMLLFLFVLPALRWWTLSLPAAAPFDRLPLFDPAIYATSFAFPSLGDLLINAAVLLVIALFIRQATLHLGAPQRSWPLLTAGWVLLVASAVWITHLLIGLVEDSSVDLDLYHVQGLSQVSVAGSLSMALLFGAWLILASSLLRLMAHGFPSRTLLLTGLAAFTAALLLPGRPAWDELLPWTWPLPMLVLIHLGRGERSRFALLVLGLVVLATFSSILLTRHTGTKERRERQVLAERLASREDPVVELLFQDIAPQLRTDRRVYDMLGAGRACTTTELDELVRQRFFGGYWERYDVRLFAFGTNGQVRCATDPEPPRSFRREQSVFTDPRAAADMPDLTMEELPGQGNFYHARVAIMPLDTLPPAQLIVELYPRTLPQGLGFPELLLAGSDPLARRAGRYTLARYERGQLVEQSGRHAYPLQWTHPAGPAGQTWFTEGGYAHYASGDPKGSLLVLGLQQPTLLDKATTFSYLFTFFSLLLALAAGLRALFRLRERKALGIGLKVRIVLVLFSATSLFFFGFGTRRLLDAQYAQRAEQAILEKARSVHMELQQRLDGEPALNAGHTPYLDHLLGRASNVFFTDITLYGTDGRMLATSRPQMFTSGLLGLLMDPVAWTELVLNGRSSFVHEESVGSASFLSAYLPLRDRSGKVLAYISLPAFADQRQQEEDRAGVLIAVVNLFVLLFALSVLVAVFISNWTLRPLDLLKHSLSGVGLRGANEPLRYRGDDEVGRLVQVYNRKVEELHESAERLAQSERETAWREMARQVAHEIKNPLTPMKLGIQQFQRAWDPAAPNARERLERFSSAMVEQIDALSGVATAFSQFAQMPVAQPQELDLNAVVRAAVDVFRATPGTSFTLREESELHVLADREHLLRVFNNLLKNAVQAMPDGQPGQVDVRLWRNGAEAVVEVRDNGIGIPEHARERIFVPSFTTKSSGMGLGLAMVKRIVENAGGRVWFSTVEGEGTSFFVALPLRK